MRINKHSMYEIFWNTTPKHYFEPLSSLTDNIYDVFNAIDKDYNDTFKPYKAFYAFKRDTLQPLFGLKNIFSGLLALPTIPFMFLWDTCRIVPMILNADSDELPGNFWDKMLFGLYCFGANLGKSVLQTGYSVASIAQGITQILTTPLTWLFKIPLRLFITPAGGPKIEENSGFRREFLSHSDRGYELQAAKCVELHRKFKKQTERGQTTNIDILDEGKEYKKFQESTSYLDFSFKDGKIYGVGYKYIDVTAKQKEAGEKATLAYFSLFQPKKVTPSGAVGQAAEQRVAANR